MELVQAIFGVILVIENGTNGLIFPIAFREFFDRDAGMEDDFLSLPEDAQKEILREEFRTGEDLHDCIERFKLKQ